MLLASGGLAACGKHADEEARIQRIEQEGFYLSLGELKYQVQGSRQLAERDEQDRRFLAGIPPAERDLESNEVWFAVFLQVENEASQPLQPSGDIEIIDTQEQVYKPLALEETNVFAYRSREPIPPGEVLPVKDSPGFDTPLQGALLLFKLKLAALDNRPLELKIEGNHQPPQTGIIDLDV